MTRCGRRPPKRLECASTCNCVVILNRYTDHQTHQHVALCGARWWTRPGLRYLAAHDGGAVPKRVYRKRRP